MTWDSRFLALAAHVATWSKDPSTKVGAVIVRPDKTISSVGFNGFPRRVMDDVARLSDRQTKLALTVHAELNAILSSHDKPAGMTLYCSAPCCERCAAHIVQSGMLRVVTPKPTADFAGRWAVSMELAAAVFREAGVQYSNVD